MGTVYSQNAEKEWWIDTGIDDPDFNNSTINQRYAALLSFSTGYSWWQGGSPGSPIYNIYTDCVPVVRQSFYSSGSPSSSTASPRIWIRARVSIRDISTGATIYKIRLDNYTWSLFKL